MPIKDVRRPVAVIRYGNNGRAIHTRPSVIGWAENEEQAVKLAEFRGFVVLATPIAPAIPAPALSLAYRDGPDAIAVRVVHDPNLLTIRGETPDTVGDIIVWTDESVLSTWRF
jgi:hypothetical protein